MSTTKVTDALRNVTAVDAAKLTGSVDVARLPSTAVNSNVDLTTLSASNLTSGTVADARFPATLPAISGANLTGIVVGADLHQAHQGIASLGLVVAIEHNKVAGNYGNTFLDIFQDDSGITTETTVDRNASEYVSTIVGGTTNATGTLVSDTQTAASSTTEVSGVFLYTDTYGTNTIGTDLKIYFTANNGTNWTEAVSYGTSTTFSGSIKQVKLGKTTVTAGTQIAVKAVWANQVAYAAEVAGGFTDYSTQTGGYSPAGGSGNIWALFDNSTATYPVTGGSSPQGWYTDFGSGAGQACNRYSMTSWNGNALASPSSWTIYASNNASSWTTITSQSGASAWSSNEKRTFDFSNTTVYRYWRIDIVTTTGHAPELAEAEFGVLTATVPAVTGKVAHLEGWAVNY